MHTLWEKRVSIHSKKRAMLTELDAKNTSSSSLYAPSKSPSNVKEATTGSAMHVVAPIEVNLHLQASALPGWISRMEYVVWDVMRFRFLCHTLVVISNSNVLVSETTQAKSSLPS